MIGKRFVSILVASLLLLSIHVSGVLAGVEPSPFQPEINQLGAVANILDSADFRVVRSMSVPPDPCVPPEPCKGLNGAVNRLEAIENQVSSADNMVDSMINEVMGFEPTPFREDLIPPLMAVGDVAVGMVLIIDEFMAMPPDLVALEFSQALQSVSDSAFHLVGTVNEKIVQLSGEPLACSEITDEETCNATFECEWDPGLFCFEPE